MNIRYELQQLLEKIVGDNKLHAKWLNTLSYLENCGARQIAACEHPTEVKEEMLKHASEEFRHAHYLKSQISKIENEVLADYSLTNLLGGTASLHYLKALNIKTSRYLYRELRFSRDDVKKLAYLLVTYAIELRAEELYFTYHEILRKSNSNIHVKSIILEEKEHLNEMKQALLEIPFGFMYAENVLQIEAYLYRKWIAGVQLQVCAK